MRKVVCLHLDIETSSVAMSVKAITPALLQITSIPSGHFSIIFSMALRTDEKDCKSQSIVYTSFWVIFL